MRCTVLLWFACASFAQSGSPHLVISQVYGGGGNTGAALRNDFIELFNRGSQPVDVTGWTVQYASATGAAWQTTALDGVIEPGQYYLVQQAAGTGGTTSLPVPDATGSIAMSATAAKVALVRGAVALSGGLPTDPAIVDLVGYGMADFAETTPAAALSNTTAALRRAGGCTDTDNNASDFQTGAPNPRHRAAARNSCTAQRPPVTLGIGMIQGTGSTSPAVGLTATTTGVVTARRSNGFFLQTPDAEADSAQTTSEGLFVFTSAAPPADAVAGNLVRVTGTVAEFRPAADPSSPTLTEITDPEISLLSAGVPLPAPVTLTRSLLSAGGGIEQLERFEGMRVSVPALRVIGPTGGSRNEAAATASTNGVFYGVIEGTPRPFREPGVSEPDALPAGAARFDANPERLRVDSDAQPGALALEVTTGAVVRNLTGPLDYGGRAYTLLPDPGALPQVSGLGSVRPLIPPTAQEFTIATFNLRRLFDTTDDPATGDPVLTAAGFERRLAKTTTFIRDLLLLPDILAVQEAENRAVLEALAMRLGAGYRAYLEEGNDPSGIDVGFLVKTSRVTVLAVAQAGKDATYTTPAGRPATLHDRPPLLLRARAGDLTFTVIANHLRSLIDIEDPTVQAKRLAQADALAAMIAARLAADPAENLVVLGDFNAFAFDDGYADVLGRINSGGLLVNLTERLPREQSYTYVHDGSAEALDHILVHRSLLGRLSRFAVVRGNADFPESYSSDITRPERVSDHDVPVAYFGLAPQSLRAAGVTNAASFLGGAVAAGEIVTVFIENFGPATPATAALAADGQSVTTTLAQTTVSFDNIAAPLLYAGSRQLTAIVPYEAAGKETTTLRVEYRGQAANPVIVPVATATPGIFAVLNEDLSPNTATNPAPFGSTVILFATGEGQTDPPGQNGRLALATLPKPAAPVFVSIDGLESELGYAGAAPGLVSGLLQVNARIPAAARAGAVPVFLTIGDHGSQTAVTVYLKPL